MNFVGLFDTVSSEGLYHGNDVYDMGLGMESEPKVERPGFVNDSAMRVFHLMALDEYRTNFSCITIDSACKAKTNFDNKRVLMEFELGIPGAHSDVGGGYISDIGKPFREERSLPPN